MVNTGHPSRACKLCRARRIKCDETKPHCLKCKKAKRQCPGYRDPFEINLRDETQSTIRKAKAAAAAQKRQQQQQQMSPGGEEQQDKEAATSSDDQSPTSSSSSDHSPLVPFSAGRQRLPWDSPRASESSWETRSTWSSSPTSQIGRLTSPGAWSSSRSPVDAFTSAVLDFSLLSSSSSSSSASQQQEPPSFDFNAAWGSLPETSLSTPIRKMAKSISSSFSFDGAMLDFSAVFDSEGVGRFGRDGSSSPHPPPPPLLSGLQTPLDEQATCFFMSNFVLSLSSGQNPCLFNFILKILKWEGIKDTPFPMALTAVSLAALSGRPNSRHLLPKSRVYYSTALLQLKDVIKEKERAKHDTSLATAILLSFYEALACDSAKMTGWSNHLDGAKALIRLRGKDVIKNSTPEGLEMFQLVRSMSIRQYMFGFVANPHAGEVEWWGQHLISDKSGHVALVLNMKTTLIRAEADALLTSAPKTADKIDKALDLLRRARAMVVELGRWLENCQPTWPKYVSGWTGDVPDAQLDRAPAFSGPLHTFPNVWIAGKHLNTNASRIMLSGIMVRCVQWICAPADHRKTDDYLEAMRIGNDEVANVIASVPYFVSWTGDSVHTPYFPCGAPTSPKAYSAVTALYPLLCTGLSIFATARQKRWLCSRLRYMSETMGIKQATLFATFISNPSSDLPSGDYL